MSEQVVPRHIQALLSTRQRFSTETLNAIREFRSAKPWRGNVKERIAKLTALHVKLVEQYGLTTTLVFNGVGRNQPSDASYFDDRKNTIVMTGRISVVTYFNLLCAARGFELPRRVSWSLQLFKRMFPLSWSRCEFDGYLIRKCA